MFNNNKNARFYAIYFLKIELLMYNIESFLPTRLDRFNRAFVSLWLLAIYWCLFGLWIYVNIKVYRFTESLVFSVMFAFPLSWTTQSLLHELAADYSHPLPENIAVGLMCLLEMLCENCMYFILYAFPPKLRKSIHNIN